MEHIASQLLDMLLFYFFLGSFYFTSLHTVSIVPCLSHFLLLRMFIWLRCICLPRYGGRKSNKYMPVCVYQTMNFTVHIITKHISQLASMLGIYRTHILSGRLLHGVWHSRALILLHPLLPLSFFLFFLLIFCLTHCSPAPHISIWKIELSFRAIA